MKKFWEKEGCFQTEYSCFPLEKDKFKEETVLVDKNNIENYIKNSVEWCLCIWNENSKWTIKMKRVIKI